MTTHRLAHTKWAEPSAYRVDRVDTGEWLRSRYIENSRSPINLWNIALGLFCWSIIVGCYLLLASGAL